MKGKETRPGHSARTGDSFGWPESHKEMSGSFWSGAVLARTQDTLSLSQGNLVTTNLEIRDLLPWETINQRDRQKLLSMSMVTIHQMSSVI